MTPMFATPTLDHRNCIEYTGSLIETERLLMMAGIAHTIRFRPGDQFIAKARCKLATEFLESPCTDLFFLDDDIGWPAEAVLRLLGRPEDVVAGIYPKKQEVPDWPVRLAVSEETGGLIERDGLVKALMVPGGFLRIKRSVIEKLAAGARKFKDIEADGSTKEFYGIFESGIGPDDWWWGEDHTFGQKWLDLGGEVWVDPDIKFTHRGNKRWESSLSYDMPVFRERAVQAIADQQQKEAAE